MNLKFPKEEVIFIETIKEAYENKDFKFIINNEHNIIEKSDFIKKNEDIIFVYLIEAFFNNRLFEKAITVTEELLKKGIEKFECYFYTLASLIAKNDFYYAKSIINRSKILNDETIKNYIDDDSNYNILLTLHEALFKEVGLCLILVNFINEMIEESLKNKITSDYIIMRYFDLLNLLYEYGIEEIYLNILKNTIEIIYEIQIS